MRMKRRFMKMENLSSLTEMTDKPDPRKGRIPFKTLIATAVLMIAACLLVQVVFWALEGWFK